MAYYEDLTPYNYTHYCEKELNVGWLQKGQPFSVGKTPEIFLEQLKWFAEKPFTIFHSAEQHKCEFCDSQETFDSGEIRVVGANGVVYAAPKMIVHYIEAHGYLPPQEFVDAVVNCRTNMVGPGQDKYTETIYKILPSFWEQRKPDINDEDYEIKMRALMTENLIKEIDDKLAQEILGTNPDFKKFVEAYHRVMPAVYGFDKK
jgi:hypothetical protein